MAPRRKRVIFGAFRGEAHPRIYSRALRDPRPLSPGVCFRPPSFAGAAYRAVLAGRALLSTTGASPACACSNRAPPSPGGLWTSILSAARCGAEVSRVDLTSGARSPWKTLIPSDRAGIMNIPKICISPDARSYAYSYNRLLSELYVVDGVK